MFVKISISKLKVKHSSGFHLQIDAWTLADEHIKIFAANGDSYSLSTAWKDVTAFEKLTDVITKFLIYLTIILIL